MAQELIYADRPGRFASKLSRKLEDGKWRVVADTHVAAWQPIGGGGEAIRTVASTSGYFAIVVEEYLG